MAKPIPFNASIQIATVDKTFKIDKAKQELNNGVDTASYKSSVRFFNFNIKNDFKLTFGDGKLTFKSNN